MIPRQLLARVARLEELVRKRDAPKIVNIIDWNEDGPPPEDSVGPGAATVYAASGESLDSIANRLPFEVKSFGARVPSKKRSPNRSK